MTGNKEAIEFCLPSQQIKYRWVNLFSSVSTTNSTYSRYFNLEVKGDQPGFSALKELAQALEIITKCKSASYLL